MTAPTPTSDEPAPGERPGLIIRIGRFSLNGAQAVVALVILLTLIAALLFYERPAPGLLLSGALWVAFTLYWSAAARHAAPTKQSESPASRALHQRLLTLSLLLLFIPVPGLRLRFLPGGPLIVAGGLVLQTLSALLAMWARRHLGRNWSGAITVAVDHQLVRSGPYRLIRHPIYTAMFGMFCGTAIVSGELHALLALAILVAAYWRKIRLEERSLVQLFGADYDAYRRDTWALIPWLF